MNNISEIRLLKQILPQTIFVFFGGLTSDLTWLYDLGIFALFLLMINLIQKQIVFGGGVFDENFICCILFFYFNSYTYLFDSILYNIVVVLCNLKYDL